MRAAPATGLPRFWPYLTPVRPLLLAGLGASVAQAVMQWLAPWPLKIIFDSVIGSHPVPGPVRFLPANPSGRLVVLTLATLVIAVLLGLAGYGANRWVANAGQRVVFDIRTDLFTHLSRQSVGFHQRRTTGDLMSRLDGDVSQIQSLMVDAVPTVVNNVVTLAGMVVIMLVMDWHFAATLLLTVPLLTWLVVHYLRRIKTAQREALRRQGEASAVAQEVLTSLTVVQAFGAEERETLRFAGSSSAALQASRRAVVLQSQFTPLVGLVVTGASAIVVYVGVHAVLAGRLTAGDLLVFMAYLRGIYTPVRQLAKLAGVVGRGHAAAERVAEILDADEAMPEPARPRPLRRAQGTLSLHQVSHRYASGQDGLDRVDLHVPAGSRLALVGATGSGKSTLLRLLPRFLDPSGGVVRLDGVDLRQLSVADLRRQIALVPQEPYLFRASVWENIAYGGTGLSRSDSIRAAKAAGVHEVIESFPAGYDTLLAERGSSLSGGQRQCLSLARAMARDAPILLLDEPTTGIDVDVEALLLQALDNASQGRTTLLASHQPRAIQHCEQVALLEHGRLVAQDTHRELARQGLAWWLPAPTEDRLARR